MTYYTTLISTLECCREGSRLIKTDAGEWATEKSIYATSADCLQKLSQELFARIGADSMTPEQADRLSECMKKLVLSKLSWAAYNERKACLEAIAKHPEQACHLSQEELEKAVEYVGRRGEICRFAFYYRLSFESPRTAEKTELFKTQVARLAGEMPRCTWLQRVVREPAWVGSLVPEKGFEAIPKHLDLQECDSRSILSVMRAHSVFTELVITLNSTQEGLAWLLGEGVFRNVRQLNLKKCPSIDWQVIQPYLAKIQSLNAIELPENLLHPRFDADLWSNAMASTVQDSLTKLEHKNTEEFARFASFMKAYEGHAWRSYLGNFMFVLGKSIRTSWSVVNTIGMLRATCLEVSRVLPSKNPDALYLNYCPNITAEGFHTLVQPKKDFSLEGCIAVTDDCFTNHWLMTKPDSYVGVVDLRCTSVSADMVKELKRLQPRATFYHDDAAWFQGDFFGGDPQGLSPEAIQALLHLKKYRYMPVLTKNRDDPLRLCKELIRSEAQIFQDPAIHNKLKRFCRFILQNNVDRNNVLELLHFAIETSDGALLQVCRNFITLFNVEGVPVIPQHALELSVDLVDVTEFPHIDAKTICFHEDAAPLGDLVQEDNSVAFSRRLRKIGFDEALKLTQTMVERFPECPWLGCISRNLGLLFQSNPVSLDLTGLDVKNAEIVLRAFQNTTIDVALACDGKSCKALIEAQILDSCRFLDLRRCIDLDFTKLEPHLLSLQNRKLQNILFPQGITNIPDRLSTDWKEGMIWLTKLNLIRSREIGNRFDGYNDQYKQIVSLANVIIQNYRFCVDGGLTWEIIQKPMMNFLLTSEKDRKRALFGPVVTFAALEIVTPELVASLEFKGDSLTFDLAYCHHLTPACLAGLCARKVKELSLYGCSYIDDSYFQDRDLWSTFTGKLDLRFTSVSSQMVNILQGMKIQVLHEPKAYSRAEMVRRERARYSPIGLSEQARHALFECIALGAFPLVTFDIAVELLQNDLATIDEGLKTLLKNYCRYYILCNITKDNYMIVYRLGQERNDPLLRVMARAFIELFRNYHYGETQDLAVRDIQMDPPDAFPAISFDLYQQIEGEKRVMAEVLVNDVKGLSLYDEL